MVTHETNAKAMTCIRVVRPGLHLPSPGRAAAEQTSSDASGSLAWFRRLSLVQPGSKPRLDAAQGGRGHSRRKGSKAVGRLREQPEVNLVACR